MSIDLPTTVQLDAMSPRRAAAFWLKRMHQDDPGEDDPLFRQWLLKSQANRLAWDQALAFWDSFDAAEESDFLQARQDARTLRSRRPKWIWVGYGVGSTAAMVAGVAMLLHLLGFGGGPDPSRGGTNERPDLQRLGQPDFQTRVGERRTISLSDGSKVTLDTDSAFDVAFVDGRRLARLVRGQAFFDVAHDAAHPFGLAAGGRVISVLGTRFNVRLSADVTRVVLVQGAIGVSRGDDPAKPGPPAEQLSPGQVLIAGRGGTDEILSADTEAATEWLHGSVRFDDAAVADAVAEINRYTEKKVVVRDPGVAALRISGAFPTDDAGKFVATLAEFYPVRAVLLPDGGIEIVQRP